VNAHALYDAMVDSAGLASHSHSAMSRMQWTSANASTISQASVVLCMKQCSDASVTAENHAKDVLQQLSTMNVNVSNLILSTRLALFYLRKGLQHGFYQEFRPAEFPRSRPALTAAPCGPQHHQQTCRTLGERLQAHAVHALPSAALPAQHA